jgi:light-regulated signal transduction histidine kinase (bacteriophytochrome)
MRKVEWRIAPGLYVVADAGMLNLILQNLLSNAYKYSSKLPTPVIEVLKTVTNPGCVEFCVRDNGAGFDMEHADQLVKPFRRLHSQDEFPGNGIGLATVHRILQRLGGIIRAEAAPGRGGAFYFSVPNGEYGSSGVASAR